MKQMFSKCKKKMILKKRSNLLVVALMILGCVYFLTGCQDDEVHIVTEETILELSDPEVKREVDYLYESGKIDKKTYTKWLSLPKEQILTIHTLQENGQIIERESYSLGHEGATDGLSVTREFVQEGMHDYYSEQENKEKSNRQARKHKRWKNMYDPNGGTVTIRVFVSDGNGKQALTSEWRDALEEAVTIWNDLNLDVDFNIVDATSTNLVGGYISVYMESLSQQDRWAEAQLPLDPGAIGEFIAVNSTTTNQTPTADARTKMMVHEIGHSLGLHHTDASIDDDIYYTAPTCSEPWYDPNRSFMYSKTEYNQGWSNHGFSPCDITNLEYYW